jgi:hypothetical protein
MLQVLAHSNLSHELVLVSVHASELSHMRKDILQGISKLECISITEPVLHVRIHNQLCQAQDFPTEVESVAEPGLLSLFRGKRFYRLQVEVVVEVQVVEVLAMDEQVEHVIALPAHLQPQRAFNTY